MENIIWMAKDESYAKIMNTFIEASKKKVNPKKDLNSDNSQSPLKRQDSFNDDFKKQKDIIKNFFKDDSFANVI